MRRPKCNDFSLCLSWLTTHHLCKRAGEAAAMVQLMTQTALLAGRAFQPPPAQPMATGGQDGTTASSGGGGYGAHLYGDSYDKPQSFTSASLQQRGGGNLRAPAAAASRSGHRNAAQTGEAGLVDGLAAPPARGAAVWGMLRSKREGAGSACAGASALQPNVLNQVLASQVRGRRRVHADRSLSASCWHCTAIWLPEISSLHNRRTARRLQRRGACAAAAPPGGCGQQQGANGTWRQLAIAVRHPHRRRAVER